MSGSPNADATQGHRPHVGGALVTPFVVLADLLRAEGTDVSTGEVLDAVAAASAIGLHDRASLRTALRAAMVKHVDADGAFDRAFDRAFRATLTRSGTNDAAVTPSLGPSATVPTGHSTSAGPGGLDATLLRALIDGDAALVRAVADQAVAAFASDADATERQMVHRALRAIDLSRMLAAAMHALRREGSVDELDLLVRRQEIATLLADFRRAIADEVARRRRDLPQPHDGGGAHDLRPEELDLMALSRSEYEQVRRLLQPLVRRLATRIGTKRKRRAHGRVDVRRTVRRSLQTGGVPVDVVTRRRHPHRPDVVVLCDVSGSVAEFAQFTFTVVNALHDELRHVRSFAFVDGVAEVSDLFRAARYEIPVNRLLERRGVVGLDGHSDYGEVFATFRRTHLDEAVDGGTTLIISGDARGNHRDPGIDHFRQIAARARRVHWLVPEPTAMWGSDDSLVHTYAPWCTAMHEVRTLAQLGDVIAEIV